MQIPDHPVIRHMESVGVDEYPPIYCPECGEECQFIYKRYDEVIGCENCVDQISSDSWAESEYGDG